MITGVIIAVIVMVIMVVVMMLIMITGVVMIIVPGVITRCGRRSMEILVRAFDEPCPAPG